MAIRTWHMLIFRPWVNVSIQSNICRFCAHFSFFITSVWKKKTFFVLFVEGWAVGEKYFERFSVNREPRYSTASAGKNPWVKKKSVYVLLKCFWTVIRFQKHYLTGKRKGVDTRDPCMTGVKSNKDRPDKNPEENLSKHRQTHLHCFFVCLFVYMFWDVHVCLSKARFYCTSYILFPVNLINVNRVVYPY